MFFAGVFACEEDACREKYLRLDSTSGLGERRWSLHLPIEFRPKLWISRGD